MENFVHFEVRLNVHIPTVEMIGTYYGKDQNNELLKYSLKIIDYAESLNAILIPYKSQMNPESNMQERILINFSLQFRNEENRSKFLSMLPHIK